VPEDLAGSFVSPEYVVLRSMKLNPAFLVDLLRSPFYRMYIDVVSTGTIRDRLYFRDLQTICVPEIAPKEQTIICERVRRVEEAADSMLREIMLEKTKTIRRLHALVKQTAVDTISEDQSAEAFYILAEQWRRETGMLSSVSRKVKHPAYQKIIAMGEKALPFILRELRDHPANWFGALKAIAAESPVILDEKHDLQKLREAWLRWGEERGYLEKAIS